MGQPVAQRRAPLSRHAAGRRSGAGRPTIRASSVGLETEFLDTSEDVRRAEAEVADAERRRSRRLRRIAVSALAVLAVAAVMATAIALVALERSQADERKASERLANLLGTQALGEARRDPLLSLALATESIARSDIPPVDAERALIVGRTQLANTVGPVPAGAPFAVGDARTLTMTPDGSTIATGSRTGDVALWDAGDRQASGPPDGAERWHPGSRRRS